MAERWCPITGFPGYDVSDQGRVRSYRVRVGMGKWAIADTPQRVLKTSDSPRYRHVGLSRDGVMYTRRVHRLVAKAFLGECPEGMEVCHNDGNSQRNHATNLRYDTHWANMQESSPPGGYITPQQAEEIRSTYRPGNRLYSCRALGRRYGVSRQTISNIVRGVCHAGGSGK